MLHLSGARVCSHWTIRFLSLLRKMHLENCCWSPSHFCSLHFLLFIWVRPDRRTSFLMNYLFFPFIFDVNISQNNAIPWQIVKQNRKAYKSSCSYFILCRTTQHSLLAGSIEWARNWNACHIWFNCIGFLILIVSVRRNRNAFYSWSNTDNINGYGKVENEIVVPNVVNKSELMPRTIIATNFHMVSKREFHVKWEAADMFMTFTPFKAELDRYWKSTILEVKSELKIKKKRKKKTKTWPL